MGNSHNITSKKRTSRSFFHSKHGVNTLQNVSARSPQLLEDPEPGYDYFSQQSASYLHDSVHSAYSDFTERQLRSSYIVDEDGGIIRVD